MLDMTKILSKIRAWFLRKTILIAVIINDPVFNFMIINGNEKYFAANYCHKGTVVENNQEKENIAKCNLIGPSSSLAPIPLEWRQLNDY